MIPLKPIEIFCGTGGVGKTTLASSRALYWSLKGKKVLLITIDPSRRLKEVLNLNDQKAGSIEKVDSLIFAPYLGKIENLELYAMLMSPKVVIEKINKKGNTENNLNNPIINILSRPYGGMNEIMAIIEVNEQINSKKFDVIILDTPPGKHFIDFLQAANKINQFFDQSFIDIFRYLGKSFETVKSKKISKMIFSKIISTGVKKLLHYLDRVTGADFVNQFIDAVVSLYRNKDVFLDALSLEEKLKQRKYSNWFLVTSVDQQKLIEAGKMQQDAVTFMHEDNYLAINKVLQPFLNGWNPTEDLYKNLKSSMEKKEFRIKEFSRNYFTNVIEFTEILESDPTAHICQLASEWK